MRSTPGNSPIGAQAALLTAMKDPDIRKRSSLPEKSFIFWATDVERNFSASLISKFRSLKLRYLGYLNAGEPQRYTTRGNFLDICH
jgi:hypothetical protein